MFRKAEVLGGISVIMLSSDVTISNWFITWQRKSITKKSRPQKTKEIEVLKS